MDKSQTLSGIGHAAVILWVVLGDWIFAPSEVPPPTTMVVETISEADLKALQDQALKSEKPPSEVPEVKPADVPVPEPVEPPPEPEPTPEPVKPEPVPEPTPEPQPAPEPVPEVQPSPEIPEAVDPQPLETPEPVAPLAEEEQPLPALESSLVPKPRPATRITDTPVVDTNDTPEVADQATPAVTDQPTDQPPVEEEKPEASPEESAVQTAPDAVESDAPELAPQKSLRPQSRPKRAVAEEPVEDTAATDAQAEADAQAAEDAQAKAIAAAAAEAAAAALAEAEGGQTDLPEGPPMTAGEKEGLRVAINQCWNIGTLSSAAQRVKLTLRVEMSEDGKPIAPSVTMTAFEGGDQAAADAAFEAAKRAVVRGVKGCGGKPGYDLDPAKYNEWNVMNLNFDASGMRLR